MKLYIVILNHRDDEDIVSSFLLGAFTQKESAKAQMKKEMDEKVKYLEEVCADHSLKEKAEIYDDGDGIKTINFGYDSFTYYIMEKDADAPTYEPIVI